jgi:hypothetical protein
VVGDPRSPPFMGDFCHRHSQKFDAAIAALREHIFEAMCEIYEHCFPTDKVVSPHELRQAGVDDRNPPDYVAALIREQDAAWPTVIQHDRPAKVQRVVYFLSCRHSR